MSLDLPTIPTPDELTEQLYISCMAAVEEEGLAARACAVLPYTQVVFVQALPTRPVQNIGVRLRPRARTTRGPYTGPSEEELVLCRMRAMDPDVTDDQAARALVWAKEQSWE